MALDMRLILKIFELVIAIICIILWEVVGGLTNRSLIVGGTVGGFTIICGVLVIGLIINSDIEKRLNGLISIIGCVLFIISGAIVISEWHDRSTIIVGTSSRNNALSAGGLMILNGVIFLYEAFILCRN